MHKTGTSGWDWQISQRAMLRTLRLGAVALSVGLVVSATAARADDDEDDGSTFEERIIRNIMTGIGGTNMDSRGIEYRERSPLVIPPRVELPPPAASANAMAPNWPKDPDIQRRKEAIAANKKRNRDPQEAARVLTPAEMEVGRTAAAPRNSNEPIQPGVSNNPQLSPSQLGFTGSFSSLFGGNKAESAPFTGEPARQALTQPPAGYQVPSPNFAYGTGPKESLNREYNPAAGKY
jgi:hypothetical protein